MYDNKAKRKGGLGCRIERARAKHELTHIVMGTIFLVYYQTLDTKYVPKPKLKNNCSCLM